MHIPIPQTIERLCYRYPSALVDAVTDYEPGHRMVAVKNVTVNEDYFQGHFPGAPLMPAVLMIETLAQVATMLVATGRTGAGGARYLRGVDNAKFRRQVVPGDRLRLEVTLGPGARSLPGRTASPTSTTRSSAEAELVLGLLPERAERPARRPHRPTAIVHPRRRDRRGHGRSGRMRSSASTCGSAGTAASARRRWSTGHRDRRRQRDLSVRLDRPDPAGPEVPAGSRRGW